MPRLIGRVLIAFLFVTFIISNVYAQRPHREMAVGQALDQVQTWLGKNPAAEGWRQYLHLKDLQAQVALGAEADAKTVAAVLTRLESGKPGLDRPQFLKLRKAVAEWRGVLIAPTVEQLPELAQGAKAQYQAADAAVVAGDRAKVAAAVKELKQFLGSGKNAKAWEAYLHLDALDGQLKADAKPTPAVLDPVLAQLRTDKAGLDMCAFTNLAAALAEYEVRLRESQNPNARAEYDAVLDKLSAARIGLCEGADGGSPEANRTEPGLAGRALPGGRIGRVDLVSVVAAESLRQRVRCFSERRHGPPHR